MTIRPARLPRGVSISLREPVRGIYLWTARHRATPKHNIGKLEAFIPRHETHYYVQDFNIEPLWQGQGIGSTMLVNALGLIHGLGYTLYLLVHRDNTEAQKLYARLGGRRDDADCRYHYTYWFRPPASPLTAPPS